ncbi:unnamed protein product [Rotaria socialis]|uniref:Uncharacterized protein n=1 Tax=Rotaria socialis TaxID=392032 RepID=A0A820AJJ8_9BILA|nr:unnamed protein product [Rotaria socialis]CAF3243887.1 unnamed protein product [Rotaria socialis]CAF3315319.1 unnamed protein product [Rotaria socialis]CAF3320558.1 unnamed protein product [Rotaria socialis]CAF4191863.1 unnamed protein product [Rotaria socialis]
MLSHWFGGHIPGLSAAACGPSEIGSASFDFYLMTWDIIQVSFYVHCLTSRLFLKAYKQRIRWIFNQRQSPVATIAAGTIIRHIQVR